MNKKEYSLIKNYDYDTYCDYLKNKYGEVKYTYGNTLNSKSSEGLFIHHIREDEVASLSDKDIAKANKPEYQEGYNLVYCNYLEHLFLHILIGEKTIGQKNLGLNGAFLYLIPSLTYS